MKKTLLILTSLASLSLVSCIGAGGFGQQMAPRANVEDVERQQAVSPTPNPTGVQGYDNNFGAFHGYGRSGHGRSGHGGSGYGGSGYGRNY